MAEFTLPRTGDLPLVFEGEQVAEASSHRHEGPGQNRWHELALYHTRGGRWVAAVTYRSRWQGEDDFHWASFDHSPRTVRDGLTAAFTLTTEGVGYPPGEQYAGKQERLETDLRRRYDVAVTELFRGPDGFAERID